MSVMYFDSIQGPPHLLLYSLTSTPLPPPNKFPFCFHVFWGTVIPPTTQQCRLCSLSWPGTSYIDRVGLQLTEILCLCLLSILIRVSYVCMGKKILFWDGLLCSPGCPWTCSDEFWTLFFLPFHPSSAGITGVYQNAWLVYFVCIIKILLQHSHWIYEPSFFPSFLIVLWKALLYWWNDCAGKGHQDSW